MVKMSYREKVLWEHSIRVSELWRLFFPFLKDRLNQLLKSFYCWFTNSGYTNTPALPRDLFDKYVLSIPGALWDDSWLSLNPSGSVNKYMLKIPSSSVAEMEDLCFTAKDVRWCLCPEAQLVPDGLITDGEPGYRYGYVSPLQTTVNQEAKFIRTYFIWCGILVTKSINPSLLLSYFSSGYLQWVWRQWNAFMWPSI
jgi:hypothetical protein